MRYVPKPDELTVLSARKPPFVIDGAPNIFLETVKRGDDDLFPSSASAHSDAEPTIVLRLYETLGGHARVKLRLPSRLHVVKAALTNLLEEEEDQVRIQDERGVDGFEKFIGLDFRGFEVKTVKLTIGSVGDGKVKVQM